MDLNKIHLNKKLFLGIVFQEIWSVIWVVDAFYSASSTTWAGVIISLLGVGSNSWNWFLRGRTLKNQERKNPPYIPSNPYLPMMMSTPTEDKG